VTIILYIIENICNARNYCKRLRFFLRILFDSCANLCEGRFLCANFCEGRFLHGEIACEFLRVEIVHIFARNVFCAQKMCVRIYACRNCWRIFARDVFCVQKLYSNLCEFSAIILRSFFMRMQKQQISETFLESLSTSLPVIDDEFVGGGLIRPHPVWLSRVSFGASLFFEFPIDVFLLHDSSHRFQQESVHLPREQVVRVRESIKSQEFGNEGEAHRDDSEPAAN
jgi:hypothetical protein